MSDGKFLRMVDPVRELLRAGAAKHGDDYLDDPDYERAAYASLLGHLADAQKGQHFDRDSGNDPLIHVAARAVLLAERRRVKRAEAKTDVGKSR